jgi:hypothetical protein
MEGAVGGLVLNRPVTAGLPPRPDGALRVAAWNCRGGMRRKREALAALEADVLVIPEAQARFIPDLGQRMLFKGAPSKGLGVLVADPYTAAISTADPGLPWLLAVDIYRGRDLVLTVLALWTVREAGIHRPSYSAQAQQGITAWQQASEREGRDPWTRVVMLGDFNASFQGPSAAAHADTVAALHQRGMASVHHHLTGTAHGTEASHTLRWIAPGRIAQYYHCDYLWLSPDLQTRLRGGGIGTVGDWVESGLSDHSPVWADLTI